MQRPIPAVAWPGGNTDHEIDPCIMIACIYKHPPANVDGFTIMILDEFLKQSSVNKYKVYIIGGYEY